jgi:hypothetical protein
VVLPKGGWRGKEEPRSLPFEAPSDFLERRLGAGDGARADRLGPRHWFSLSRAWVLALGQQEMEGPAAKTLGDWVSRTASQHPRGKAENPTAYANRLYGLLSADPKARSQFPNTDWQSIRTRLYELELVPRRRH